MHVVCPQVWAWHQDRIPKVAASLTKLLCFFPFEPALFGPPGTYGAFRASFIGHPMVDVFAEEDRNRAADGVAPGGVQVNDQLSRCADDWVQLVPGSTGQMRQEINPLLAHRDKTSRTVSDDLDALQFTPRSKFKKLEGKGDANSDPMREFFKNTQM